MKSFNLKASINSKLEKFYHQYNLRKVLWRGNSLKIMFLPLVLLEIVVHIHSEWAELEL